MEIKNNGIIFEVIKINIGLQILELNKYLMPKKVFRVIIFSAINLLTIKKEGVIPLS